MDFGRQRGLLLDRKDQPEKVGCRKESYFLEFMYVVLPGILLEQFSMSFLMVARAPLTTGTIVVLSPRIRSTSISKSLYLVCFSMVLTDALVSRGIVMSMRRQLLNYLSCSLAQCPAYYYYCCCYYYYYYHYYRHHY